MDYSPPGSSVHGILQAKILDGIGCHFLLPTQGWTLGLLHCTQILYGLSYWENPIVEGKQGENQYVSSQSVQDKVKGLDCWLVSPLPSSVAW